MVKLRHRTSRTVEERRLRTGTLYNLIPGELHAVLSTSPQFSEEADVKPWKLLLLVSLALAATIAQAEEPPVGTKVLLPLN